MAECNFAMIANVKRDMRWYAWMKRNIAEYANPINLCK